jgi:hypothetical protein
MVIWSRSPSYLIFNVYGPCFSSRVNGCFKPTEVASLKLVVQMNDLHIIAMTSSIQFNGSMTSRISIGYSNAFWTIKQQCLSTKVNVRYPDIVPVYASDLPHRKQRVPKRKSKQIHTESSQQRRNLRRGEINVHSLCSIYVLLLC